MHEIVSKRKAALDQLRKGLTTLGVLEEIQKYPSTFESLFTYKSEELTSTKFKEYIRCPDQLSVQEENIKSMVIRFIDQSPTERLMLLMLFCTGCKVAPSVQGFKIDVGFHDENCIFSSTCTFTLQIPRCFTSYGQFEATLASAISLSGKSFTSV